VNKLEQNCKLNRKMSYSLDKIVGKFDYIKKGSIEQYEQSIDLRADKTCTYREVIETKQTTVTRSGDGVWSYSPNDNDSEVKITIKSLKTETVVKQKIIPGFGDSVKHDKDVIIDIKPKQLVDAPAQSSGLTNKWRRI